MGISKLTEVQELAIPAAIAGKDVLARSATGSGKTLAFLLGSVERILKHGGPNPAISFPIVILTPVRDLAVQIADVSTTFLKYHPPMKADAIIGGTDEKADILRLSQNRVDVLVATPGRFKSILQKSEIIRGKLSNCQTFVIDEADKLMDPGFLRDTQWIANIAGNKQTLAFSATMDKETLLSKGLLRKDAVLIEVSSSTYVPKIRHIAVISPIAHHLDVLCGIVHDSMIQSGGNIMGFSEGSMRALRDWKTPSMHGFRIMAFAPSNAYIDFLAEAFRQEMNIKTFVLHGGLTQGQRTKASDAFRSTSNCILFTSDASARGVDYTDVTCVIQFGFDSRAEYLQRAGRTGRAGKAGISFVVLCPQELAGATQICDVIDCVYAEKQQPFCTSTKHYDYRGVSFRPNKHAKAAVRGYLGALASKWKTLKMAKTDILQLAQQLCTALGVPTSDDKLKEKLHLR